MLERSLFQFSGFLAQTSEPATSPADSTEWHAPWQQWLHVYETQFLVMSLVTLGTIILSYWVLSRIFRKQLQNYELRSATAWGTFATALYFTMLALHPKRMIDHTDIIAVTIHKSFAAVICFVGIRYIDRLVVVPILTRISGGPPSRFIHQIVVTLLSMFVIAGYCSWAFGIEIGALLTGSAVISIVIGLALQETLGNFFSGMVLQASVPFQTNDWIMVGTIEGRVVEMTWRAVTLITPANNYILIPNSVVAKEKIVNYHTPSVSTAVNISVGLDYAIPPNDAKRVLVMAAMDTPGVLSDPAPSVSLASFDDSSIGYKLFFWINEPEMHGAIEQAVRVNVWYRLKQAGFGIPFPVRTLEVTNLEKKQSAMKQSAAASRLPVILEESAVFRDEARASGETGGRDAIL